MACIHCGQSRDSEDYVLQFTSDDGEPVNIELSLCDECLDELLSEPEIEF